MARRSKIWMYAGARAGNKPSPAEKAAITSGLRAGHSGHSDPTLPTGNSTPS